MKLLPIIQTKILPDARNSSEITLLQPWMGYGKSTALTRLALGRSVHHVQSAAQNRNEMILNFRQTPISDSME